MKRIFVRILNLVTFKNATYSSVFPEGNRRIVFLLSLIIPITIGTAYRYFTDEYVTGGEKVIKILGLYLLFHVALLLYIWVLEGKNKVRGGGNAIKTLRNLIFLVGGISLITFLLVGCYEIVETNRNRLNGKFTLSNSTPEDFKINEFFAEEIFEKFKANKSRESINMNYEGFKFGMSTRGGRQTVHYQLKSDDAVADYFDEFENQLFTYVNEDYARKVYDRLNLKTKGEFYEFISDLYYEEVRGEICEKYKSELTVECDKFEAKILIRNQNY